jgi:D-glycero-D-manno-heptose 1,7-bisphosphate phosphatase
MQDACTVRQAAILVGGRGTRLGDLTDTTPKPLLTCGDRPFLAWLLRELIRFGIDDVLLLTGYLADAVEASLPAIVATLPRPLRITCVREMQPAGTGGALLNARAHLAERFLLCNGDSWLDCNLARLLADATRDPADTVGHMLLRRLEDASRYGVVETDGDRVVAFLERPEPGAGGIARPGTINAGVYLFDRRVLDDIQPVCSLERDVMPLLAKRGMLRGTPADGYFIDIGIPTDLARSQTELPARLRRRALLLPLDLVVDGGGTGAGEQRLALRPDAVTATREAADAGWHVFVLADHALARRDAAQAGAFVARMCAAVRAAGGTIDDVGGMARTDGEAGGAMTDAAAAVDLVARWHLDPQRCVLITDAAPAAPYISAVAIRRADRHSLATCVRDVLADGGDGA